MGLIKAAVSAAQSVLADQWKEYFYCDSIANDIIVVKGKKRNKSLNNNADDNVITNGSGIVVADGQCMIIVDNGKVADYCAEPGQYTYDQGSEPSLFDGGNLADNAKAVFLNIGKRFTYGGEIPKDQRVYYFNIKEIMGNKFGTATPILFQDWDHGSFNPANGRETPLSLNIRCYGKYTFRLDDMALFMRQYASVGNVVKKEALTEQMRSEVIAALQAVINAYGTKENQVRALELPSKTAEMKKLMDENVFDADIRARGVRLVSFIIESVSLDEKSQQKIDEFEAGANAAQARGSMLGTMRAAASNEAGAGTGFMGIGMAGMGFGTAGNMMGGSMMPPEHPQQQQQQQQGYQQPAQPQGVPCPKCGTPITGKFCPECGTPAPAPAAKMKCPKCGTESTGKFCPECGTPLVAVGPRKCPKCGTEVTGKFCPECGTPME